jgi:hypothetical protein
MVGVDTGCAPCKLFISHGFHGTSLSIATLALTSGFLALAFPSLSLYPWTMGSAPSVTCLRKGGPFDAVCSIKGERGISLFPPTAIVSFLLTFTCV